ncbi:MAG: MaoC family dehydratase N-terminal domain-containing protein [Myxococcales bacterium]|nr:MaoC family dehydratase N-terminal domain-containing protein [Myxococcales bacterium]MCB9532374.1 MaoC family dehydratase N-terminal domain-containing protein [Myxococcales bacterium]
MVDRRADGLVGEAFELDVERGKVREFARSVHAADRAFYEGDRPIAPPTFLTTAFHWELDVDGAAIWERVAMSHERGMHAEQEYVFHGPPPAAGDGLIARSRIESMYEKEGRRGGALTFVVMVTEYRNAGGELVAEARMTGVETAKPPTEEG